MRIQREQEVCVNLVFVADFSARVVIDTTVGSAPSPAIDITGLNNSGFGRAAGQRWERYRC